MYLLYRTPCNMVSSKHGFCIYIFFLPPTCIILHIPYKNWFELINKLFENIITTCDHNISRNTLKYVVYIAVVELYTIYICPRSIYLTSSNIYSGNYVHIASSSCKHTFISHSRTKFHSSETEGSMHLYNF